MPRYTIVENPPPFTQGQSTTSSINVQINNRQIYNNPYRLIQLAPIKSENTVFNNTVINQEITVINEGSQKTSAEYKNLSAMSNITTRRQLINDGLGVGSYDDNNPTIWSVIINQITCSMNKKFIEAILSFTATTDTLGGAFEIEAYDGTPLRKVEETISIEEQDFSIRFRLITNQNSITNGIKFFITPELGMKITITDFSLVLIKD